MSRLDEAWTRVRADCERLSIDVALHEHPAVFTVEESADLHARIPGAHTKNLFLKDHRGRLWLVTMPATMRADLKRIGRILGGGRLSFGSPELMAEAIGVAPGAVTPIAAVCDTAGQVTVVLDTRIAGADLVAVHPLRNTATMVLPPDGLVALLRAWQHDPVIADLAGEPPATA